MIHSTGSSPTPEGDPSLRSSRRAAAARTRERLIDAGLRLADRTSLSELSINLLVAEAGVSKGTFFHHFGDRTSYVIALHRRFHDRVLADARLASKGLAPGQERLMLGAQLYLDACRRERGVRALLLEARAVPEVVDEIRARNRSFAALLEDDFRAIGREHPNYSARLWVSLIAEAALIEYATGRRTPALRAALAQFISTAEA